MAIMRKKHLLATISVATLLALQGCSSVEMAPQHADADAKRFQVEPQKAVVYVVQTGGFTSSLALFQVNVGTQFAGSLTDATYLRVVTDPGETSISIASQENQRSIRLKTAPGSLTFVGASASLGLHTPRVSEVTRLEQQVGMEKVASGRLAAAAQ